MDSPANSRNADAAPSDERLMLDFSQGSAAAFNELFQRYKQPLYGFFRRRLADSAHAEELTQETFLAILRAAGRYEPRALFRTYLYAVAFRILRAHRRKSAFRAAFWGVSRPGAEAVARESGDTSLALGQALGKLDTAEREILLLREFEQLEYAEIADLLELPLNTVRSRLFRARMALREILCAPATPAIGAQLTESKEHA